MTAVRSFFNREKAIVSKNNKIVTVGTRNLRDGLWDIIVSRASFLKPTSSNNSQQVNEVISLQQTKKELLDYLQASLFSPVKSTVLQAILNNNLFTFPGLDNIQFVRKHLQQTMDTLAGHQKQERRNLQSTNTSNSKLTIRERQAQEQTIDIERDHFPAPEFPNAKSHNCFAILTPFENTAKAYADLTGKFPIESSRGNKYVLIVYDYDSNAILAEALQNRQAGNIKIAWEKIHGTLVNRGAAPKLYIMDNEASQELKSAMTKKDIQFELVPPMVHRRNAAERAIQTFKDHFIAGLASVDPQFPIQEWDRLLPQATITLNLLRNTRVNPKLSSYAYLFGVFDFNKTPLAPPGTKVSVHNKADQRASWARRGTPAWYIGPAMEHYRCVTCYDPATRKEKVCDTVEFLPHKIPFPKVTVEDYLCQAVTDIVSLLKVPPASTLPTLQYGNSTLNAFRQIANALNRAEPLPAPSETLITTPTPNTTPSETPTTNPNVPPTSVLPNTSNTPFFSSPVPNSISQPPIQ